MAKNKLLLSSVAFGISFALSLLINRNVKTALITGLISVPATLVGVFVVNGKQRIQQKRDLNQLEAQIYQLKLQEVQLNKSLSAIAAEEQRTKSNINFLKTELKQLYAQITEQRSYKQQLTEDITTLSEHSSQLETHFHDLQAQIEKSEQRKRELREFMQFMQAEKQDTEANINLLRVELQQLQVQVTERQNQKNVLEEDLTVLKNLRPQLETQLHQLQNQITGLETQKKELNESLAAIVQEKYITEINLELLQKELNQIQIQILEQQNYQEKLEQDLIIIDKSEANQNKPVKKIDEWQEFVSRLNSSQLQVLKAIIHQSDPSVAIKKIAEENLTMPELLIDAINECALDTIGDLIIEPGSELLPLGIIEEYLTKLNKIINIDETN